MMLSLGLSFSPFPAGDLVSRESQKTKEFGVEEENFEELGLPLNSTVEIDFRELWGSDGNLNRTDGKRTMRLAYLQNFIPIGRLDREISTFLYRAFLAVDRVSSNVSSPPSSAPEIVPRRHHPGHQMSATSPAR